MFWNAGLGERIRPDKQDSWRKKAICTVERAKSAVQQAAPRTTSLSTSLQKASLLPPHRCPCWNALQHLSAAPCWGTGLAGRSCCCWGAGLLSLQRQSKRLLKNARGATGGDRPLVKNTPEHLKHRMPFSGLEQSASLGHGNTTYRDWGKNVCLTILGFSAQTDLVAGHPVTYLYMQSMCSVTFLGTINYMYKIQTWKPGGSLSSKLTITIILLRIKD